MPPPVNLNYPLQNSLRNKVDASDIASLMPSGGSGESASLMPKVLELQTKINALEGVPIM